MTDTDVFALVSSVVWVVGLGLGYAIGYLGGATRTRERVRLAPVRIHRSSMSGWRRTRPAVDARPGRVIAPRTVTPPRSVPARMIPRARMAPPH